MSAVTLQHQTVYGREQVSGASGIEQLSGFVTIRNAVQAILDVSPSLQAGSIVQQKRLMLTKSLLGEMSSTLISVATRAWLLSSRAASTCTLQKSYSSSKAC